MRTANRLVPVFLVVALAMFVRAPYLIDAAPQESTMGLIQKIFYFHVPSAATAMMSAFVCGAASALYLWRRRPLADHFALAAAELVVVFGLIVLVTGPLWARKAWGVWWQWEPRLTITLVMWMIFVAYLLLRRFGGPGSDVLAAAVGLFGAVLVPFVYWSVNVWRTLHPTTDVVFSLPPPMMQPFLWCMATFFVFYAGLLLVRVRLEMSRTALEHAYLALED
jgi:heme exporter protein C